MRSASIACALLLSGGAAWADDTRVRTSATVEVIDDRAQIDDVISRLRATPPARTAGAADAKPAVDQSLKAERPPAPTTTAESHRALGPDAKIQPPGSRRSNRERSGNPDHLERPRPNRRP